MLRPQNVFIVIVSLIIGVSIMLALNSSPSGCFKPLMAPVKQEMMVAKNDGSPPEKMKVFIFPAEAAVVWVEDTQSYQVIDPGFGFLQEPVMLCPNTEAAQKEATSLNERLYSPPDAAPSGSFSKEGTGH